ncbi:hypothetical protein B0H16DRAFT_1368488 [Mycena metata]|uniref:Uncharacterized protein n=1 Tax=Mycena metata TaxID=1033252 RepID=A0AAD7JFX2_9AGAR|nr:hypothetical protein B0H16DRAFT_1368488 [Mycena metata]
MHTRVRFIVPSLLTLAVPVLATVDFQQCFADIRQGLYGTTGGTDSQGNPVTIANATSITYELCLRACGTGSTPFSWPAFNQQFSAWLLPWLALTSQFPFGSRHKWENFLSAVLALGSPCLAAYSLILTVLHTKWLARRFANIEYPNGAYAARILNNLQQTPIMVRTDGGRLASLIVLPENDPWWMELAEKLDDADTHTWSIATAASIAWVVIAYALTIVDASSNIPANSESNLSGAGSIWVWMLPVTLAYLQISPRDPDRVTDALARARESSFVAGPNGVVRATQCALSLRPYRGSDQENPTPIYAYARFFPFIQAVEKIASALDNATEKFIDLQAVGGTDWVTGNGNSIDPANRTGTPEQIEEYCAPPEDAHVRGSYWGPEALSTFFIAALAALTLQWATTGASILLAYVTPAVGLGCASLTYLLHGILATLIWGLFVLSSVAEHYATTHAGVPRVFRRVAFAAWSAVLFRRVGKLLAILNALWIVLAFLLRFSNFYHRCRCNSDVLGLGKSAYLVLVFDGSEISVMRAAWVGGVALAVIVSGLFLGFINLPIKPPFASK